MPKKKKIEVPMMITQSKVKEYAKDLEDVNVGGDFMDALNTEVARLVTGAVDRSARNGRKTLKSQDV